MILDNILEQEIERSYQEEIENNDDLKRFLNDLSDGEMGEYLKNEIEELGKINIKEEIKEEKNKSIIYLPEAIIQDVRLSKYSLLVYAQLLSLYDTRKKTVEVGKRVLSNILKISKETISKCIDDLRRYGYLKVQYRKGNIYGNDSNSYELIDISHKSELLYIDRGIMNSKIVVDNYLKEDKLVEILDTMDENLSLDEIISKANYLSLEDRTRFVLGVINNRELFKVKFRCLKFDKRNKKCFNIISKIEIDRVIAMSYERLCILADYSELNNKYRTSIIQEDLDRLILFWLNSMYFGREVYYQWASKGFIWKVWSLLEGELKFKTIENPYKFILSIIKETKIGDNRYKRNKYGVENKSVDNSNFFNLLTQAMNCETKIGNLMFLDSIKDAENDFIKRDQTNRKGKVAEERRLLRSVYKSENDMKRFDYVFGNFEFKTNLNKLNDLMCCSRRFLAIDRRMIKEYVGEGRIKPNELVVFLKYKLLSRSFSEGMVRGLKVFNICGKLGMSKASISKITNNLVKSGLIERNREYRNHEISCFSYSIKIFFWEKLVKNYLNRCQRGRNFDFQFIFDKYYKGKPLYFIPNKNWKIWLNENLKFN